MSDVTVSGLLIILGAVATAAFDLVRRRGEQQARRDEQLRTLQLEAISKLNRLAEIAEGRWWHVAVTGATEERRPDLWQRAADDLHDAWYASRDFDLLFPDLHVMTDRIRAALKDRREEAARQAEAGEFLADTLNASQVRPLLDELSAAVATRLGLL